MDDGISTGGADLVTLSLAVDAAGETTTHVSIVIAAAGSGLHQTVE